MQLPKLLAKSIRSMPLSTNTYEWREVVRNGGSETWMVLTVFLGI